MNLPDILRLSDYTQLLSSIEEHQQNELPFSDPLTLLHDIIKEAVNHDQRFVEAEVARQEDINSTLDEFLVESVVGT